MDDGGSSHFSAIDSALLGCFFISYSVLALVQISSLFSRRYVTFGILAAGSLLVAQGFALIDFSGFCAERSSVIICSGERFGLTRFGMVWVYVTAAMLGMYGFIRILRAIRGV